MHDAVTLALRACIVPVRCRTPKGLSRGSAFHVAPRLLLTCAHVVAGVEPVQMLAGGQWQTAERLDLRLPLPADVALLRSPHSHPQFVRLGRLAALRDRVRAMGFPVRNDAAHEDQILGLIEALDLQHAAEPWKSGVRLLKFKDGQVWDGFSGAPLYDERTRRVVGVVCATRDKYSDLGGIAVPAAVVIDAHVELRDTQRATDWDGTVWRDPPGAESGFLEHYLDPLKSPFFGRDAALSALDRWLASASPRALLVADPGRGKSSLLAHWYQRLSGSDAVHEGRLQVALVPISIRFRHARENEVLASLYRRFTEWHPELRSGDTTRFLDQVVEGLRRDAPAGQQLLLLVDGLDETVGWAADHTLFPRELGNGVRVLAAARRIADRDHAQWRERLGWRGESTTELGLDVLTEADTRDAAARWWPLAAAGASALGQRIHALSGGDPLVVGAYLGSFGRDTAPTVERLADLPPGLDGVFELWLEQHAQQRQRDAASTMGTVEGHLFNLLACAFEPVPRAVLLAVIRMLGPCTGDELDGALRTLARFIVGGAAGYSLAHPALARWRWRKLQSDGDAQRYDEAFAQWMRKLLAAGDAAAVDPYALRAGTRHLQRSGTETLADWHQIAGDAWRAMHQRADGWPHGYREDLALAAQAAQAADQDDLAAGQPCRGLPLLAGVAFGRLSIDRLTRRVPARLAAQAVRFGLWTSARALQHVLEAHQGDFPRIRALGAIAPWLAIADLEQAMAALTAERSGGFDWDDRLGTWELARAAARSGAFDEAALAEWAQSLQGIGAPTALLSLAVADEGDARRAWIERALASLPAAARHVPHRTCLALGVRVARCIGLDPFRQAAAPADFDAWGFASRLGFARDPSMQRGETAAAALRVAWDWLDPGERERCVSTLVGQLPRWIEALQSGSAAAASDERWSIVHRDWQPRLGAIWDVCSIDAARTVHRQLRGHFERQAGGGSNQRTCFAVMLRFASRLPQPERRFEQLDAEVRHWAFAQSSTFQPEVDELYDAAASLPEWSQALADQAWQPGVQRHAQAVGVLVVVARHLPLQALDRHWQQVGHFDADWRDRARRAVLAAMAGHGESAVRMALQRADEPDLGLEHRLLDAVLAGLRGYLDAPRRDAARLALAGFRGEHARQAQLLSAVAAPLAPWSLDEVQAWVPKDRGWPSLAIGWLLPHLRSEELCDAETPWRLAIRRAMPDTDAAADTAIRIVHGEAGFDAVLAWAAAMDEACDEGHRRMEREHDRDWTALAICTLAELAADRRDQLLSVALALHPADARAEACAALCAGDEVDPRAWAAVESELRDAAAYEENTVARILRRLSGDALRRGLEVAEVNTRLLVRSANGDAHRSSEDSTWAERAGALLAWADAAVIDRHFMPGGRLADVDSSTARNLLRAGLAPRLLELGRVDEAMAMAATVSEPQAWLAHVAMLDRLGDAQTARRFVAAMMETTYSDLSLFAVARELQRGACSGRPDVLREICKAVLDAADSDARLRLHLAVLMPLFGRLCGDEGIGAIATYVRGQPA